jgi:hypothetical protein
MLYPVLMLRLPDRCHVRANQLRASEESPPHVSSRALLGPYADALKLPLSCCRSLLIPSARCWHFVLRKILGPWLHVQSYFNLSLVEVLEQVDQRVRLLEKRQRELLQTAITLKPRLPSEAEDLSEERRGSIPERLPRRIKASTPHGRDAVISYRTDDSASPTAGGDSGSKTRCLLEQIFFQTHLPSPPARVLILGENSDHALAMAQLGFGIERMDAHDRSAINSFAEESFDVVIFDSTDDNSTCLADVSRPLRQGGRFFVTLPWFPHKQAKAASDDPHTQRNHLVPDFHPIEQCLLVRRGNDWSLTVDEEDIEQPGSVELTCAVCLLALDKPKKCCG